MVSFDVDMLAIGTARQRVGVSFAGIIYAHPARNTVGDVLREVELIANVGNPQDLVNTILYVPL